MAHIVHFGKYFFPDVGGIESVTNSVARGAATAGHSVSIVCFDKNPDASHEAIKGVEVFRAKVAKVISSQPLGFRYLSLCMTKAKTADIVHLHTPNMLGALCALFIKSETRLVVHWHSDVVNKGLLGKLMRPLEFALLRRADRVVAATQVYADTSDALAPYRDKTQIVPYGVPDSRTEEARSALPLLVEEKLVGKDIILAVGRLVPYKGFEVLINAARVISPRAVVVIVGGGPLQEELQAQINAFDLNDRVLLAGRLSDDALHSLFLRAALYCLPSVDRAEAFGVVLLEAMAYGVPIVASDIPGSGAPWVNQHGASGLNVPVGDAKALAQACNQILNSIGLRETLAKGARHRFLTEFTEDVSVKRLMDVYDELLF